MNKRSIVALLLAVLTLGSLLAPVSAADSPAAPGSSFSDISDPETARSAEILRLLGVMEGVGGGRFDPDGPLTRAQFTKMVIALLGETQQVQRYAGYTIFPDVRGSHWAAGYVNYALRGCSVRFISGYPDGSFGPEDPITLGQAVTILMRLLGYTDGEVGLSWPDGYLATAAAIGLTDGLEAADGFDAITRAQAAGLFVRLLETRDKTGNLYAASRFTLKEDTVVLSTQAEAQDGTAGALETTEGIRKVKNGPAAPLFTGLRGTLLLDSDGLVQAFLPERGTRSRTLAAAAVKADGLVDGTGKKYPISGSAALYLAGESTTYAAGWSKLTAGTPVTVYYNAAGQADYLFAGSPARTAAVVQAAGSVREIQALAQGTEFTIYKNGAAVEASALRQFDVVTYDAAAAAATVCDLRLAGCVETASPSYTAATSVTVLGQQFQLLPAASADLASFRQGDPVVLLMTAEGRVAGIRAQGSLQANVWGIVRSCSPGSATVELSNGMTVTGDPGLSSTAASRLAGCLVTVTSSRLGKLELTELSTRVKGDLDLAAGKLGDKALSPRLRIFEKVTGIGITSGLQEVDPASLPQTVIPGSALLCAGYDYLGRAEVLVLEDLTGDSYEYGMMTYTPGSLSGSMGSFTSGYITIENGSTHTGSYNIQTRSGVYGGMVLSAQGGTVVDVVVLQSLPGVSASAFRGAESVTVQGTVYPLSAGLKCYNKTLKAWVSLNDALAYSDRYDLYYDRPAAQGGKIRVLVVE